MKSEPAVDLKIDRDSRFLYAEDFVRDGKWVEVSLTIAGMHDKGTVDTPDGKTVDKYVMAFVETEKLLVLNATNLRLLVVLFGSKKSSDWIGHKVTWYPACGDAFGQRDVPWIRLRMPADKVIPFGTRKHMGRDLT